MLPDKMEHCIVFMNSWDVSASVWCRLELFLKV